jgi:hypothetical protein
MMLLGSVSGFDSFSVNAAQPKVMNPTTWQRLCCIFQFLIDTPDSG